MLARPISPPNRSDASAPSGARDYLHSGACELRRASLGRVPVQGSAGGTSTASTASPR